VIPLAAGCRETGKLRKGERVAMQWSKIDAIYGILPTVALPEDPAPGITYRLFSWMFMILLPLAVLAWTYLIVEGVIHALMYGRWAAGLVLSALALLCATAIAEFVKRGQPAEGANTEQGISKRMLNRPLAVYNAFVWPAEAAPRPRVSAPGPMCRDSAWYFSWLAQQRLSPWGSVTIACGFPLGRLAFVLLLITILAAPFFEGIAATVLLFPFVLLLAVLVHAPAVLITANRSTQRLREGACIACGYDLGGTPAKPYSTDARPIPQWVRCPECGELTPFGIISTPDHPISEWPAPPAD
jgi:hypothetical protein